MPAKNDNLGQGSGAAPSAQTGLSPPNPGAPGGAILIADDSPDDALHSKIIVEKLHLPAPVHLVFSGEDVLAYLEGQGGFESRAAHPYPVLLLLDLRMPGMDGYEVLKWLRARPEHQRLPVVVMSVVRELREVSRAYQLGARSFLIKPLTVDELRATLQSLAIVPSADLLPGERKAGNPSMPNLPETGTSSSAGAAPQNCVE
jgi:CheY-like chemotaxis protein